MQRFSFLLFSVFIMLAGCNTASEGYTVKVKINNPKDYTMFLAYPTDSTYTIDTSFIMEDGWAIFKGKVESPIVASFGVRGNPALTIKMDQYFIPGPGLDFFLSNDEIKITGDADRIYMATVQGGKANTEWNAIKGEQNKITEQRWQASRKAYETFKSNHDSSALNRMHQLSAALADEDAALKKDFMAAHPNSVVSMYFLAGFVNDLKFDELKEAYDGLGAETKNSYYATRIVEKIKNMEATAIGKAAIPINKTDINGNPVTLETLKGKYVLLDFWGSWCGPCRAAFPHLKELYAQYKKDGFEILGIAQEQRQTLEQNIRVWKQAVAEEDIPWLQVLNNQGIDTFNAVEAYGVTAFPTQILLDQQGKIIARYVGESEDLDKKLKEVFGY